MRMEAAKSVVFRIGKRRCRIDRLGRIALGGGKCLTYSTLLNSSKNMLKRHQIQVLRRAGHTLQEVVETRRRLAKQRAARRG